MVRYSCCSNIFQNSLRTYMIFARRYRSRRTKAVETNRRRTVHMGRQSGTKNKTSMRRRRIWHFLVARFSHYGRRRSCYCISVQITRAPYIPRHATCTRHNRRILLFLVEWTGRPGSAPSPYVSSSSSYATTIISVTLFAVYAERRPLEQHTGFVDVRTRLSPCRRIYIYVLSYKLYMCRRRRSRFRIFVFPPRRSSGPATTTSASTRCVRCTIHVRRARPEKNRLMRRNNSDNRSSTRSDASSSCRRRYIGPWERLAVYKIDGYVLWLLGLGGPSSRFRTG